MANKPDVVSRGELREKDRSEPIPGIERTMIFAAEEGPAHMYMVKAHVESGASSGWHHHGDNAVYSYLLEGHARVEYGPEGEKITDVHAGEFIKVPPQFVHRDVNPTEDTPHTSVTVIFGTGQTTFNVDGPEG